MTQRRSTPSRSIERRAGRRSPTARSASGSPTPSAPGVVRGQVEDRQPHADADALGPHPLDDRAHASAARSAERRRRPRAARAAGSRGTPSRRRSRSRRRAPAGRRRRSRRRASSSSAAVSTGPERRASSSGSVRAGRGLDRPPAAVGELEAGDLLRVEEGVELGEVVGRRRAQAELVRVGPARRAAPRTPRRPTPARRRSSPKRCHRRRTRSVGRPSSVPSHPSIGRMANRLAHDRPATSIGAASASTSGGSANGRRDAERVEVGEEGVGVLEALHLREVAASHVRPPPRGRRGRWRAGRAPTRRAAARRRGGVAARPSRGAGRTARRRGGRRAPAGGRRWCRATGARRCSGGSRRRRPSAHARSRAANSAGAKVDSPRR